MPPLVTLQFRYHTRFTDQVNLHCLFCSGGAKVITFFDPDEAESHLAWHKERGDIVTRDCYTEVRKMRTYLIKKALGEDQKEVGYD